MEHLYVQFGDPSCISFLDIVQIKRKNDEDTTPMTAVGIGNNVTQFLVIHQDMYVPC